VYLQDPQSHHFPRELGAMALRIGPNASGAAEVHGLTTAGTDQDVLIRYQDKVFEAQEPQGPAITHV
jgi:hypothetical protein